MSTIDNTPRLSTQRSTLDQPRAAAATSAETRLRQVLRANAGFSAISGIVGLAGAGFWADRLGTGSTALTAVVSLALLVFAVEVWWSARLPVHRLRPLALAVSAADLAWVGASIVIVALGLLTTAGAVVAAVLAVLVADFAATQLWFRSRIEAI